MSELVFGDGVSLVAGPEQIPLDGVLVRAGAAGRRVLVVARGAPQGRPDPARDWLAEPAGDDAIARWIADQEEPCAVVVMGALSLGGWLAGESSEQRLSRFLDRLPRRLDLAVVLVEPVSASAVRQPDRALGRLLGRVDRTWLWTGSSLLRAREALAAGAPRPPGLPWYAAVRDGWFWAGLVCLCAVAAATVLRASGAEGTALLGNAREVLPRSLWVDAWFSHQLATGGSWVFSDTVAWPSGADVIPHVRGLGAAVVALPFVRAFGYPEFWNPLVALALVCNGLAAGWLARVAGADRGGVVLAALGFLIAPPVLTQVGLGDQAVFWAAPLAVAIGLGMRALDGDRRDATLSGAAIGVAGLFWWFYALFAAALLLSLALARALRHPAGRSALSRQVRGMLRAFLPFSVGLVPMIGAWVRGDWPRVADIIGPKAGALSGAARVWFHRATTDVLSLEQLFVSPTAGAGWLPSLVVLVVLSSWVLLHRGRRIWWAAVAAAAAVLAMGVWLDPRWGLSSGWLPLPLRGLQVLFPPLELLDRPDRFLIITALATAVMAGLLWRPLCHRLPSALRPALWTAGLALVGASSAMSTSLSTFLFEAPGWTRAISGQGAVLHVPMGLSEADLMWQPLHGQPITGGPDEAMLLDDGSPYRLLFEQNAALAFFWDFAKGRLDSDGRAWLLGRGARYVVVYEDVVNRVSEGTQGETYLMPLADRIEQTLGPAIYNADGVRVYSLDVDAGGAASSP